MSTLIRFLTPYYRAQTLFLQALADGIQAIPVLQRLAVPGDAHLGRQGGRLVQALGVQFMADAPFRLLKSRLLYLECCRSSTAMTGQP